MESENKTVRTLDNLEKWIVREFLESPKRKPSNYSGCCDAVKDSSYQHDKWLDQNGRENK